MDSEDANEPGQDRNYRPKCLPTSTDVLIGKHRVGRLLPLEPGRSGVHGQGPLALVVGSPRGVLSAARCAAPCPATLDVWLPARA
jgi:hypothetical protein